MVKPTIVIATALKIIKTIDSDGGLIDGFAALQLAYRHFLTDNTAEYQKSVFEG